MLALWFLDQVVLSPSQLWPVTLAGWIGLLVSFLGIVGILYGYAKAVVQINGLGGRVTAIEQEQERSKERESNFLAMVQRVTDAQANLLEKIGEARTVAAACDENSSDHFLAIGVKLDTLLQEVHREARSTGERLKGVETTLEFLKKS